MSWLHKSFDGTGVLSKKEKLSYLLLLLELTGYPNNDTRILQSLESHETRN